ncbi:MULTISPECIES: cobalt ECF transporter T component CbiQ [Romboutsia]|uniref:Cobalt transport protein CbiQ n=1 Tax=Romboutsia hominis TaxID=1507512 RepID=A0A2P2BUR5_9FIRM|nr:MULTISPECIES: cobalt ECF transporter T component CbiQ [Romboutsia]MCH1960088.1 cobalt ECF transporter T component CbiQ [Romboutsia hominis]MCH1969483.1 cobalt ECF transporter T component CbiQ [Romboutsia hominis]MDB8794582.1 cobalt ECF transporter T component CbiQ [Romboutsia sp. 1001216sp1]MDB8796536.1 cobalt ECF transporter T component CbiQ [Romboutsia sp. 1001216sp1]MDB8798014.1 cobalt ECF transporter T component CbiQ [Romboutsia sp. 1001216sp1]
MLEIDKCAYTNALRNTNPMAKLLISFLALTISVIINNIMLHFLVMLIVSFLIIFIAKVNIKLYIKCLRIPIYFLIIGTILNMINISFENQGFIFNIKVFNLYIGTTLFSVKNSIYILLRAISSVISIYFLILTTPFNQLIIILKKLHIPDTLVELMVLTYRFIFIFLEEIKDIYKSQELRFGYINLKNSYNSTALLIKILFFRMMRKYEDMSITLDMKLYDGKFHI